MGWVDSRARPCRSLLFENGFARIRCPECFEEYLLAFSCKTRELCPSCAAKRSAATVAPLAEEVLEEVEILPRMERVLILLSNELELAKAQQKIRKSVEERMEKQQREFFLKEQLREIQKELGLEKDDRTAELDTFRQRIGELELSEQAAKRVEEEMNKLAILEVGSPEYALTRNYIDWITLLPWGRESQDNLDLDHARRQLDGDHYGLEDVKQRIIEFLAVGRMRGEIAGSIILLVGPPGVGKTSIGRSIADALGRSFYRFSVGGIRDEDEVKGHRRTYIGAMPGKFIQAMKEAGTQNPVIMLDEIDKIGASYQGDPASALLEVLDPEQNYAFSDHYLEVAYDLSRVMFIATANNLQGIPGPLIDRTEVIQVSGYTNPEKVKIGMTHLFPKVLEEHGLDGERLTIDEAAMGMVVEKYTREAADRRIHIRLDQRDGATEVEVRDHGPGIGAENVCTGCCQLHPNHRHDLRCAECTEP